ncbi:hypothetical protein JOF53_005441 [Crossiella equi]|uniref:Uncharacterized protein n=1 Tax=Crossiella equi TaxID=130796 RepID=A0ABS5AJ15_9PSEU|nr:hypothetical protein [Crossiella equi]MBP2476569.1 hypothetical protein [Crossiella equi]
MPPLQHAASALGWHGVVIPDVAVLGQQVSAVVRVLDHVHEWRTANGWPPEPDPSWFRSWFEPDFHDQIPVPAVELSGVLVIESSVESALNSCGTLMTLAPCAVVLPAPQPADAWPLIELDYYGIGVVTADSDGADVLISPEDRSREFGPSLFGRWLQEVLYEQALKLATQTVRTRN